MPFIVFTSSIVLLICCPYNDLIRDLNARISIIDSGNAQLFVSIHVNSCSNSAAQGSIVFYSQKFEQNEALTCCIQLALNAPTLDGDDRTKHNPQEGDYYILNHSDLS